MKPLFAAALLSLTLSPAAFAQTIAAQSPTPQQLLNLRLHDGFTLIYQVTVRDVRTAALRQKDVTDQQAGITKALAEGHLLKSMESEYRKQALDLGLAKLPEHFAITLSARGGKLLYLSTRGARYLKDGTKAVIVLDGNKEYESDAPDAGEIENDGWRNGPVYADENVDRLTFCPLPGVGLPDVDLVQSPKASSELPNGHLLYAGSVPRLNLLDGETPYKAGSVEAVFVKGRLRIVALTVGVAATPQQVWQMTAFRLFQDHWLATRMRWAEYEATFTQEGEKTTSDLPTATADYQLVEAKTSALDVSAFEIGSYLSDKARVADNSEGATLFFAYDKQGGTLEEQAEVAAKKESTKVLKTP